MRRSAARLQLLCSVCVHKFIQLCKCCQWKFLCREKACECRSPVNCFAVEFPKAARTFNCLSSLQSATRESLKSEMQGMSHKRTCPAHPNLAKTATTHCWMQSCCWDVQLQTLACGCRLATYPMPCNHDVTRHEVDSEKHASLPAGGI